MAVYNNGVKFCYPCGEFIKELQNDAREFNWEYVTFAYYLNEKNIEIPLSYKAVEDKWDEDEFKDQPNYKECDIMVEYLIQYLQTLNSNI